MTGYLPLSEAAERNKLPILKVIRDQFCEHSTILEIGSGTGQHAAFFASQMPTILWKTSDLVCNHAWIEQTIAQIGCENTEGPFELDVRIEEHWNRIPTPASKFDGVFSANTAHIMSWNRVIDMFRGVSRILAPSRKFLIYGPFNHNGEYTSLSNASFDQYLKSQNSEQGIRDDQELLRLGESFDLNLQESIDMPANNRILIFTMSA
ncbi:MAG: DUF938 domain-containing protein [Gammaproteobacteria bacterium]|nr:DUF938 domain-containing protein [Gammaproteobacteria bacterium]MCY4218781.1 DUF938 domain-containing protein [Gammaproteobacteria bacterium]MCY4276127.1 DUF938 domain-containing protein [Gammaproteobacteria bacterium]